MIDTDDLEPKRPVLKPVDLQTLSIQELGDYVQTLEAEITRTKAMIAKKEAHKNDVAGLFKI